MRSTHAIGECLALVAMTACWGCGTDDLVEPFDGSAESTTPFDANRDVQSDDSVLESGSNDANGDVGDASVSVGDAGLSDASVSDGSLTDTGADASDAGCVLGVGPTAGCGIVSCNYATSYCVGGSVPNVCKPIPVACQCQSAHTCGCVLANTSPCDGGSQICTAYADGGQLFVAWLACK